jgi:hypothetical protein
MRTQRAVVLRKYFPLSDIPFPAAGGRLPACCGLLTTPSDNEGNQMNKSVFAIALVAVAALAGCEKQTPVVVNPAPPASPPSTTIVTPPPSPSSTDDAKAAADKAASAANAASQAANQSQSAAVDAKSSANKAEDATKKQ